MNIESARRTSVGRATVPAGSELSCTPQSGTTLVFEMWIAGVKSRINAHYEWLTNQPINSINTINLLARR